MAEEKRKDNRRNDGPVSPQAWDRTNAILRAEIAKLVIPTFSWEHFRKTEQEKEDILNAKMKWRAYMKQNGLTKRCGRVNAN